MKTKGVQLRARKGFWAPTPDEIQRANLLAHANEPRPPIVLPPARRTSPMIRPWFGMAKGAGGNTRVTFVWEPAGAVPGDRRVRTPSRVAFKATGANGTTLFEGPVRPTGAVVFDGLDCCSCPCRLRGSARADPPGDVDRGCGGVGDRHRRARSLVGDLRAPVAIGTPEVLRARTAKDMRALEANPDAVPVASRQFSRSEQLVIRVPVYAPGSAPDMTARLISASGQSMRPLTIEACRHPGRPRADRTAAGRPRARRLRRGDRGGKPRRAGQRHAAFPRDELNSPAPSP